MSSRLAPSSLMAATAVRGWLRISSGDRAQRLLHRRGLLDDVRTAVLLDHLGDAAPAPRSAAGCLSSRP